MVNKAYPILCGGTFFTLVLEARKQRSGRKEQLYSESDGLSEPETLVGLIRVMYPEFKEPSSGNTFKTATSSYKMCKNNGCNLPFFEKEINAFDSRVKNDYQTALSQMSDFIDRFVEVGDSVRKDEWLVKALIDLIESDQSVKDAAEFYIRESGEAASKAAISDMSEFSLPAFLLGVWHFCVVSRRDNTVGSDTFEAWCPPNNRKPRLYTGNMGEGITRAVRVTAGEGNDAADIQDVPSEEQNDNPHTNDPDIAPAKEASQTPGMPNFYQYGNNNVQIGRIESLIISHD